MALITAQRIDVFLDTAQVVVDSPPDARQLSKVRAHTWRRTNGTITCSYKRYGP